jgi:serine/threonine-protein kinase
VSSRVGQTFGKYKIISLLGRGGMGEVYEAHDTSKNRTVALKILRDEYSQDETFRTRFLRESHSAAVLQEPHVIPIHDWGDVDGNLFIDMRLVTGQTLDDLLTDSPLAPDRAVAIIAQIGAALDAAHAHGLIHRDVKPANIIVTPADFAYLVDFGLAQTQTDAPLTMAGTHIGSMAYMAPERFYNQPATPAVDIYALACVLYESLTGDRPFPNDNVEHVIAAHIAQPPPRPSEVNRRVPASFDAVVARGMAKDPDDRYGSAAALGRAAQRALAQTGQPQGNTATAVGPSSSTPTWAPYGDPTHAGPAGAVTQAPYSGPPPVPAAPQTWAAYNRGTPSSPMPASPTVDISEPRPAARRARWLLPAGIVVAAVLLGTIGVVIGLLAGRGNSGQTVGPSPTPIGGQSSQTAVSPPQTPTSPAQAGGLPPIVQGPDNSLSHQSCDQGFSLPTASGFGSHAGRGTPETSCYFASSVLTSYWNQYGNASRLPRTVAAPGAVNCNTINGAECAGPNFLMQCAAVGPDNWITCTGGNNARVYLY